MARPIYPHEMNDADFQWLISTFRESRPYYFTVEASCLPLVLVPSETAAIETLSSTSTHEEVVAPGTHVDDGADEVSDEPEI